jgi:hypothetical protein
MSFALSSRRTGRPAVVVLSVLLSTACSNGHHSSSSSSAIELTGRVYTTNGEGQPVAGDLYALACDVYLCGGPLAGGDDPGLPPGEYYFQVTDGAGTVLLSQAGPQNGVIAVPAAAQNQPGLSGVFGAYEGEHEALDDHSQPGLRVRLCPFESSSPDGSYKVWLTPRAAYAPGKGAFGFLEDRSLTSGFLLSSGVATLSDLVIRRFCDRDADGSPEGEALLDGVRYMVSVSSLEGGAPFEVRTGDLVAGEARVTGIPSPASFTVCELVPGTGTPGTWWYGTLPGFGASVAAPGMACYLGQLEGDEQVTLLFGAACVSRSIDGRSGPEFLSGEGKALLQSHDPAWRQLLDAAGLVTAAGDPYDVPDGSWFAAFASFSSWMASDGSTNEAHLLSREIAAALLAAEYAGHDAAGVHVQRPAFAACHGAHTVTSAELVVRAQSLVRNDGFTPPGDPNAEPQRCARAVLASINTNASPLLSGHCCEATYP